MFHVKVMSLSKNEKDKFTNFKPFVDDWSLDTKPWIKTHKDDIERIYTTLWQESMKVMGHEYCKKLNIRKFAEWYRLLQLQN